MAQEKTPDKNDPTKIDPAKKDEHLQGDLTDEELTSVVGGASKRVNMNITGVDGR